MDFALTGLIICCRKNADVDCKTNMKYTPLHRCAHYGHRQLAQLLILAGADQEAIDQDGRTPYECAVSQENEELMLILKPYYLNGRNVVGSLYAVNNPKHPDFRPEARDALFALYDLNESLPSAADTSPESPGTAST